MEHQALVTDKHNRDNYDESCSSISLDLGIISWFVSENECGTFWYFSIAGLEISGFNHKKSNK